MSRRFAITDKGHLHKRIQDGIALLLDAQDAWLAEDHAACTPGSQGLTPVSGGGTSNPTERVASGYDRGEAHDDDPTVPPVDNDKYRERDHIGAVLDAALTPLERLLATRRPVTPDRNCHCCGIETATHGRNADGRPVACWACHDFYRRMRYRCDAAIHDGRGKTAMCECGPECCEVCPDKAVEGRTVSDRCRQRKYRRSVA